MGVVFLMVQNVLLKMDHKIILKYFVVARTTVNAEVMAWESIGLSVESFKPPCYIR